MEKIKETLLHIFTLLKKELLLIAHFFAAIVASYFIYLFTCGEPASDVVRNMILATGGIGGFYALIIAKKRQDRFEEQVTLGQEQHKLDQKQFNIANQQMFNERLGRGVELLSNSEVLFRLAGIRVLNDLLQSSNEEQQKLIIQILTDFLHSKSPLRFGVDQSSITTPRSNKLDIELTVRILMEFTSEYNKIEFTQDGSPSLRDSQIQISFDRLDLSGLDFSNTKFSNANFSNSKLDDCNFSRSKIINSIFIMSGTDNVLEGINFTGSKFVKCYFSYAHLKNVDFSQVSNNLQKGKIQQTMLIETHFDSLILTECNFNNAVIDGKNIENIIMPDAQFRKCMLINTQFKSLSLDSVMFTDCNMNRSQFKEVDLAGIDPLKINKGRQNITFQKCIQNGEAFSL